MRIVCDNCGAKYQISDEKVRNKVFKIRCKRCAHVIVVRANQQQEVADQSAQATVDQPAAAAAEQAPVEQPAAERPDAIWYVVVNREQVGPLTPAEIQGRFEAGEIDAETFTWAEGMGDWIRFASVPEFAHMVPAAPEPAAAAPEPAAPVASAFGAEPEQPSAAMFASPPDEADDDVMASNNQPTGGGESLFGSDDDGFDEGRGPRVSSQRHLRGQRNENSVLFSLDALAADAEQRPVVSSSGGSEASGLIDISALGGNYGMPAPAVDSGAMDAAFGGASGAMAPVAAAPTAPMPTYVTNSGGGGLKVALIVIGVLILLGGGVAGTWFFLKSQETDPDPLATNPASGASMAPATVAVGPASKAPASVAPATTASIASAAPASAAPESAAPESVAAVKPRAARPSARRSARKPRSRSNAEDKPPAARAARPATRAPAPAPRPAARSGKRDEVDDLLGSLDSARTGKKPARAAASPRPAAAGADPMLPQKLSRTQILRVVKQNAGNIRRCKERDPGASGNVMVGMVIGKNGRVTSANVKTAKFKGSPVGNCVAQKVKAFKFPQFSGDAMRINMPFGL